MDNIPHIIMQQTILSEATSSVHESLESYVEICRGGDVLRDSDVLFLLYLCYGPVSDHVAHSFSADICTGIGYHKPYLSLSGICGRRNQLMARSSPIVSGVPFVFHVDSQPSRSGVMNRRYGAIAEYHGFCGRCGEKDRLRTSFASMGGWRLHCLRCGHTWGAQFSIARSWEESFMRSYMTDYRRLLREKSLAEGFRENNGGCDI